MRASRDHESSTGKPLEKMGPCKPKPSPCIKPNLFVSSQLRGSLIDRIDKYFKGKSPTKPGYSQIKYPMRYPHKLSSGSPTVQ